MTDLENNFTYHKPNDEQARSYVRLRKLAKELAHLIDELCPPGREAALAMTKLEESVMWANAGIAREKH